MNINIELENKENEIEEKNTNKTIKRIITIILSIITIIFLIIIYARYKATTGVKINEYKITNSMIPTEFHGTKLVQISDIHYGNTTDINELKKIVGEINKLKPDILVLTGDLLDKQIDENTKEDIIDTLKKINVTLGAYAITGETDYDINLWNDIIEQSGFTDLNNIEKKIYNGNSPIIISNSDTTHDNIYSIYLLHEPDKIDNLENSFNLILSGHSLNGQINIPVIKKILLPNGAKKYYYGHYKTNDSDLYVSSGIGTTDFKFRFLNKPAIELYRLTNY